MRITFTSLLFILISILYSQEYKELMQDPNVKFESVQRAAEAYFEDTGIGRGTGYKQYKRWEYFALRNLDGEGRVRTSLEEFKRAKAYQSKTSKTLKVAVNSWNEMGPLSAINTSTWSSHLGRISAIGLDDSNHNHFIVGSPSGGVWKTTDEGQNWTPIFDDQAKIDVWSLSIHPTDSDLYLAGTRGLAIMRSTDGGMNWDSTYGISYNALINTITHDPTNPATILALDQRGEVFRSTDVGINWSSTMSTNFSLYDLEFKEDDPSIVFVSGRGVIYKSIDNGQTFSEIIGPWSDEGALMLATTPHDANYIYALQTDQGGFGALYLSTDGGVNWTVQSSDANGLNNIMGYNLNEKGGQAPRDMDIVVSPNDKNEVHVAGIMTYRSFDGGQSWTHTTHWVLSNPLPFIHADCDLMIYRDTVIFFGTDGGIFLSRDKVESVEDLSQGIGVRQFYKIGVSQAI